MLVVGKYATTTAPTFSIDSTSKLDLLGNDLIVHGGDLSQVQSALVVGRNVTPGGFADQRETGT